MAPPGYEHEQMKKNKRCTVASSWWAMNVTCGGRAGQVLLLNEVTVRLDKMLVVALATAPVVFAAAAASTSLFSLLYAEHQLPLHRCLNHRSY
jgi:hypothetical protein